MSRVLHAARLSRPVFLIVAGLLVGATVLAPVAARVTGPAVEPDVIQTRSVSCAGLNWYPTDSATGYTNFGPLRYRDAFGGTGDFRCDPGLPNKAAVTKVQFTLSDGHNEVSVSNCALVRSGLTVATAQSFQVLASVPPTEHGAGTVRLTDSSIEFATIDNAKFGYWLQCNLPADQYGRVGLYGANVIYTIDTANG